MQRPIMRAVTGGAVAAVTLAGAAWAGAPSAGTEWQLQASATTCSVSRTMADGTDVSIAQKKGDPVVSISFENAALGRIPASTSLLVRFDTRDSPSLMRRSVPVYTTAPGRKVVLLVPYASENDGLESALRHAGRLTVVADGTQVADFSLGGSSAALDRLHGCAGTAPAATPAPRPAKRAPAPATPAPRRPTPAGGMPSFYAKMPSADLCRDAAVPGAGPRAGARHARDGRRPADPVDGRCLVVPRCEGI